MSARKASTSSVFVNHARCPMCILLGVAHAVKNVDKLHLVYFLLHPLSLLLGAPDRGRELVQRPHLVVVWGLDKQVASQGELAVRPNVIWLDRPIAVYVEVTSVVVLLAPLHNFTYP